MTPQERRTTTGRLMVRACRLLLEGRCHTTWQLLLVRKAIHSWRADLCAMGHANDVALVIEWMEREARAGSRRVQA